MSKHVQNSNVSTEAAASVSNPANATEAKQAARRKFLFGGVVATPTMLILAGRPVLGHATPVTGSTVGSAALSN